MLSAFQAYAKDAKRAQNRRRAKRNERRDGSSDQHDATRHPFQTVASDEPVSYGFTYPSSMPAQYVDVRPETDRRRYTGQTHDQGREATSSGMYPRSTTSTPRPETSLRTYGKDIEDRRSGSMNSTGSNHIQLTIRSSNRLFESIILDYEVDASLLSLGDTKWVRETEYMKEIVKAYPTLDAPTKSRITYAVDSVLRRSYAKFRSGRQDEYIADLDI
jgi:hypothetical protein